MNFQDMLVRMNGVLFCLYGAGFIILPERMMNLMMRSAPPSSVALVDMRAMYGGMSLGLGLYFCYCARSRAYRPGLYASIFVLAATAFGRLVGMLAENQWNPVMELLLIAEMLFTVLAALALRKAEDEHSGI